jgi:hypothetical protein
MYNKEITHAVKSGKRIRPIGILATKAITR